MRIKETGNPEKIRHKMCAFVSTGLSRVAEATLAKPTLQGVLVSWYSLVAVGLSAATLSSLTHTKSFLRLPAGKDGTSTGSRCQGPISSAPNQHLGSIRFLKTLCRCLIVPAYAEEAFWRCFVHPPPTTLPIFQWATCTILKILTVNMAFTAYHPIVGIIVWDYLPTKWGMSTLHRPGVSRIFSDPAFLVLTFILGTACSVAYMLSGGGLYAPVFIHGVAVAVWLEGLGGADALRGQT